MIHLDRALVLSRPARQPVRVDSLKDYLAHLAARPAVAAGSTLKRRQSCVRCDGEIFFLSSANDAVCAGCGAALPKSGSEPDFD